MQERDKYIYKIYDPSQDRFVGSTYNYNSRSSARGARTHEMNYRKYYNQEVPELQIKKFKLVEVTDDE